MVLIFPLKLPLHGLHSRSAIVGKMLSGDLRFSTLKINKLKISKNLNGILIEDKFKMAAEVKLTAKTCFSFKTY
jgi:hypothetical protein